ncbi:MAG: hypothetical protein EPN33_14445 [Acidobacteria bacterium]|nr:MAG: hypothetical protein EPN33_14445 [Acidobacteriota bacterium]
MMMCLTSANLRGTAGAGALLLVLSFTACGGSSSSTINKPQPPPAVAVALTPGAAQTIDQGQSVALIDTVSNDSSNKGVTWAVSGGGTLANETGTTATYQAPATVSSAVTAKVTATSAASTSASASVSITVNPPPVVTTSSLPDGTVGTTYSATLAASGGTGTLAWAVSSGSLPAGLSLTSGGVVSGTPTEAGKSNFSVTATDAAKVSSAAAAFSLTISGATTALTIATTALAGAIAGSAYSATLAATGGTAPYSWSLAAGSTLPSGLTLSPGGVISGTPPTVGTSSFTVQVTDSAATPAKATKALSLTVNAAAGANLDGELKGQYALLASDPEATEQSAIAGSITLDGSGTVTGGEYDVNGMVTDHAATAITGGTYTVGSNGLGTLAFHDASGASYSFAIAAGSLSNGVALAGALVETDGHALMTGRLGRQNSAAFSLTAFNGSYAYELSGADATFVEAGRLTLAANGVISNGLFDENDGGTATTSQAFTGTATAIDANGRGTVTTTAGSTSTTLGFYVLSAKTAVLFVSNTTALPALTGEVKAQTGGPYSTASLSGNAVIANMSATATGSGHIALGLVTFDGVSAVTGGTLDTNDGGTVALNQPFGTGLSYAITSAANGRFTITGAGIQTMAGYLTGPDSGFGVNLSGTANLMVLYAQSTGPFTQASLAGTFVESTEAPLAGPVTPTSGVQPYTLEIGVITVDSAGNVTGTVEDFSRGTIPSPVAASGTLTVASNGRVTSSSGTFVTYIISPTHARSVLVMPNDPNPVIYDIVQ